MDFHEPGFATGVSNENRHGFWFQLSSEEQQEADAPWGSYNVQALNHYSYVQNNPLRYTDPTGHEIYVGGRIYWVDSAAKATRAMNEIADFLNDNGANIGIGKNWIRAEKAIKLGVSLPVQIRTQVL